MDKNDKDVAEFDVRSLLPIAMILVVLTIGTAFGLQVLGEVKADMTANSSEANATDDGITAIAKIPAKLGTVATIIMAAVVIGVLIRYMVVR